MKKTSQNVLLIAIGSLIFSIGVNFYIIPNQLSEGGILGLTIIAHYLFQWSPGFINFILNILLFLIGYKFFDKRTILYTILSIIFSSVFLYVTEGAREPLTNDTLLAAIFAGLFVGMGLGIIFRAGGTTGGTTVLARLANQLWGWSLGKAMLIIDIVVVAGSILIIGLDKSMYTLITVYIGAKAIDFIVEGLDERVAVLIISNSPDQVLNEVTNTMSRGITVLEGRGGYTGANKEVLYIVINRQEIVALKNIIKEIDENAYVTVHNVHEVMGKGYKASKVS
ncbi:YitT family protein [Bacillus sp. FJAT-50079]|uniref:YitT family protein n=1 Tax=Bacillus sp. FJAT-50079 TaxID=2833577 RepID=UPI001BC9D099|nr:YitT family protein [Bacillus sp. FJAT-50079]MBS4206560.1 YitT family protein [Bacillus sp. FJAT-50079]